MKEDWLKDIHDRMIDYETDEPSNLWEDISRTKKEEDDKKNLDCAKYGIRLWAVCSIIAAAIITAVFFIDFHVVFENKISPIHNVADISLSKSIVADENSQIQRDQTKEKVSTSIKKHSPKLSSKMLAEIISSMESKASSISDSVVMGSSNKKTLEEKDPKQKKSQISQEATSDKHYYPYTKNSSNYTTFAQSNARRNHSNNFSFGVFFTGETGSSFNRKSMGSSVVSGVGPDDSGWEDSPLLGILVYNQGKEIKTEIKHHLPIRTGILFTYNFNNRIGLESGMIYTNLTSDIKEGSQSHYFNGEQTLHYVGIPLNLKSRIYAWKGFELYTSLGILAEKCVSGNIKKEYVLDNILKKAEKEDIDIKPLQWSANASVGVQYNITPLMGLYVEPGMSYYFKNSSPIKTIYKDKPLNFNLNLGVRFTFGNK